MTAELARDTFARARSARTFTPPVDLTPQPTVRRPTFTIGPGFWILFGAVMWIVSVLFCGWTIARVWG